MTTPNHAIMTALIVYPFVRKLNKWIIISLVTVFVYLGIRPDVEKFFYGESWSEYSGVYHELHELVWQNLIVPFQNVHILLDYFTHDHIIGGWTSLGYVLEILLWFFYGFLLFIYVEVKRL